MPMTTHIPVTAVLFDFDGTLTTPGALNFPQIKRALGCPEQMPLLEFIETIPNPRERQAALDRLNQFETRAARRSTPNVGTLDLLRWLKNRQMAVGILTRNSKASVLTALNNFDGKGPADFDVLITRDDAVAPKPSGDGVLLAADRLQISTGQLVMVGDYIFDCQAGRQAGARTVLLDPSDDPRLQAAPCDFRIKQLDDLKQIILNWNKE